MEGASVASMKARICSPSSRVRASTSSFPGWLRSLATAVGGIVVTAQLCVLRTAPQEGLKTTLDAETNCFRRCRNQEYETVKYNNLVCRGRSWRYLLGISGRP